MFPSAMSTRIPIMSSRRLQAVTIGLLCWWMQMRGSKGDTLQPVVCQEGDTICNVSNAYGLYADSSLCKVAKVWYPSTEDEVVVAVADAVKNGQKIRVVSKGSHSIPKLVCPGLGDGTGVSISTRDLNKKIDYNSESLTVEVDAGVQIREFTETIAKYGAAFPHAPYWNGLSISGLISTGAHGSSLWGKGAHLHEYVLGMRLVVPAPADEGYAKVVTLVEGDEDLKAAKVALGVLGVITSVTLQLQPMFKRSLSMKEGSDENLETILAQLADANEFGDVTWFPHQKIAHYRSDNRVDVSVPGSGTLNYTGFTPLAANVLEQLRAAAEESERKGDSDAVCKASAVTLKAAKLGSAWTNNGKTFEGFPVIGFHNLIQSSGSCDTEAAAPGYMCRWDPRVKDFFHQVTFSISLARAGEFVRDVKEIEKRRPGSLCLLEIYGGVGGILMRFVRKSSDTYLGEVHDTALVMDFTFYRPENPATPRMNEDAMEEIEQMLLFKYGAKPHWGKNRPIGFKTIPKLYPDLPKFLAVKNKYDPNALFSNEWTDSILDIDGKSSRLETFEPHCALEGLCICSADVHCAPDAGYFCQPGVVYTEARVCRSTLPGILNTRGDENLIFSSAWRDLAVD